VATNTEAPDWKTNKPNPGIVVAVICRVLDLAVGEATRHVNQETIDGQITNAGSDCAEPFDVFIDVCCDSGSEAVYGRGRAPHARPVKIGFESEDPVPVKLPIVADLESAD